MAPPVYRHADASGDQCPLESFGLKQHCLARVEPATGAGPASGCHRESVQHQDRCCLTSATERAEAREAPLSAVSSRPTATDAEAGALTQAGKDGQEAR